MPIKTAKAYGLMQAKAHGTSTTGGGPSAEVAREMIEKTPPEQRSRFAKVIRLKRKRRS